MMSPPMPLQGTVGASVTRSAGLRVLLIGASFNFKADLLIGSPIIWHCTDGEPQSRCAECRCGGGSDQSSFCTSVWR